jgi:hypothetical protein
MVALWSSHVNLEPDQWSGSIHLEDWFLVLTARGNKEAHSLAILTAWHIWKERNARVFNFRRSTELMVVTRIKDELEDWFSARREIYRQRRIASNIMSN